MKWSAGILVLLATLGVACGKPPLTPPSQGGERWVGLKSANIRLVSDLSEEEASRVVTSFEETYGLLGEAVFNGRPFPSFSTNAVVFRSTSELSDFVADDVGGQYMPWLPNDLEPAPTLLASGSLSPFARLLFAHELTHRFNHVALGTAPVWLNEGLAEYYSTVRGDEGKPVLGEIDPRYMCVPDGLGDLSCYEYERLSHQTLPSASQIVGMDREAFYLDGGDGRGMRTWEQKRARRKHYSIAWLLVHMLMHSESSYAKRFRYVLGLIPDGHKGEQLAQTVRDVDSAVLDRDFTQYLAKKIPWRQHHSSLVPAASLERRTLNDSEVLLLWARLDSFVGDKSERARRHLQAAAKSAAAGDGAPSFWLGRHALMNGDAKAAEQRYRRSIELEPQNAAYLYGLLNLQWGNREGAAWDEAAHSESVAKTIAALLPLARTAQQLNAVAAHQLLNGDTASALATSGRACKADPACWPCFHNQAAALFAAGDLEGAVHAETEALGRLPETADQRLTRQLQQSRSFYLAASADPDSVSGKVHPGLFAP